MDSRKLAHIAMQRNINLTDKVMTDLPMALLKDEGPMEVYVAVYNYIDFRLTLDNYMESFLWLIRDT